MVAMFIKPGVTTQRIYTFNISYLLQKTPWIHPCRLECDIHVTYTSSASNWY